MKNKSYRFIIFTIVAVLLMALPSVSLANLTFIIPIQKEEASISYAGGNNDLIGSNILVNTVSNGSSYLNISGSKLSFNTGGHISTTTSGVTNWLFNGGGSIIIKDATDTTVLLTGSFSQVVTVVGVPGGFNILCSSLINYIAPTLAQELGFTDANANTKWIGATNLMFMATINTDKSFTSSNILDSSISNTPVPLPAAFVLFGSGLFGLVCIRRRKI